uniref:Uncharacterized protein n=1 Tax=Candidatus Kentrum sp. DK TaxID=2126562 RepID=A0A450TLL3_9GAMM|nr:MAG: hypothetical protein BECKDK2373C_GA0170839_11887 [Candidatus Kentron sp. DK]
MFFGQALINDLSSSDEPLSVSVQLETHSYPTPMERFVTQADIGLILSYEDQFDHDFSFRRGWLLQAKRLFSSRPLHEQLLSSGYRSENRFTENSRFESQKPAQHERMRFLRDWAGCDFIRYLLYCPRPSSLDKPVRERLSAARARTLATDIFDHALGLELRDDFLSENPTIAAGVFVALLDSLPNSLLAVHTALFSGVSPFSWFIVSQLAQTHGIHRRDRIPMEDPSGSNIDNPVIEGLIRGDTNAIRRDDTLLDVVELKQVRILPAHTISIKVINGIDRPRSERLGLGDH